MYPALLEKYRVIIYSGDQDFAVSFVGSQSWISNLKWKYQNQFNNAEQEKWLLDKYIAGYITTYDNLSLILIRQAGHLVPTDQPLVASELLRHLVTNTPF